MKNNTKNEKLAELVGILLGDGSLSLMEDNPRMNNRMMISFHSEDTVYITHVSELVEEVLGEKPILKFRKKENTADLFIFKKKIILFLVNEVGLKLSPKWNRALIPLSFLEPELALHVLRGYFDTDGSLVITNNNGIIYPRLEMKICPSPMQEQFIEILKQNGFHFGSYAIGKGKIRVQMNGKKQLQKWLSLVGFNNPKHTNKLKFFTTL